MSIFNTATAPAATAAADIDPTAAFIASLTAGKPTPAAVAPKAAKAKSQYWMNVGVNVPGMGDDGGDVFISIPGVFIPLDEMKPDEVKGSNPKWIAIQQAKNQLQALVCGVAGKLEPGERKQLSHLKVEVARINNPAQVADSSNDMASAVAAQFQSN